MRFDYCCVKLGIRPPIFSKAYEKESRGKIEKFFEFVKYNFEAEVVHRGGFDTVDELNKHFTAWLTIDYQRKKHSETGETPEERFLRA